jgi:hypothetical protein
MNAFSSYGSVAAGTGIEWKLCDLIPLSLVSQLRADRTVLNTAAAIAGQGNQATASNTRGNTASRPASNGGFSTHANTETGWLQWDLPSVGWTNIAPLAAPLSATHAGSYVDARVGTGTRNTGSITINPTGGAGGYTYSHQLIITDTTGPTPTLNSPTSQTFSVSAPSAGSGSYIDFLVISTITDSAGATFQYVRGGSLRWEI